MPPLDSLLSFFAIAALLGLSPGPDNLYVLNRSLQEGKQAGWRITLGLCSGLVLHTVAAIAGISLFIASSPTLLGLLKFAGSGYLLYLAWSALRTDTAARPRTQMANVTSLYRRGILMNLSNPKVLLFFLAFLPQFVAPERGDTIYQLALLGAIFIVATLLVFGSIAWFADRLSRHFDSPRFRRWLNRMTAAVFVVVALHLLLQEIPLPQPAGQ